jgi:hypothetical protein
MNDSLLMNKRFGTRWSSAFYVPVYSDRVAGCAQHLSHIIQNESKLFF